MEWKVFVVVVLAIFFNLSRSQETGNGPEVATETRDISGGADATTTTREPTFNGFVNPITGEIGFSICENGKKIGIRKADGTVRLFSDKKKKTESEDISGGMDASTTRQPIVNGYVDPITCEMSFPIWENGKRIGIRKADGTVRLFSDKKKKKVKTESMDISGGMDASTTRQPIVNGYVDPLTGEMSFPIWENGKRIGIRKADGTVRLFSEKKKKPRKSTMSTDATLPESTTI